MIIINFCQIKFLYLYNNFFLFFMYNIKIIANTINTEVRYIYIPLRNIKPLNIHLLLVTSITIEKGTPNPPLRCTLIHYKNLGLINYPLIKPLFYLYKKPNSYTNGLNLSSNSLYNLLNSFKSSGIYSFNNPFI